LFGRWEKRARRKRFAIQIFLFKMREAKKSARESGSESPSCKKKRFHLILPRNGWATATITLEYPLFLYTFREVRTWL